MMTSFVGSLHGSVEVGHIFLIVGKTIDGATELVINLSSGKVGEVDIPFRFSVRFHNDNIVRNSKIVQEGGWGHEEIEENLDSSLNPIVAGMEFKVYILTGDDKFHVAVNGKPFCTYNYRLPLDKITTVQVLGEVQRVYQVDHRRIYPSAWPFIQEDAKRGQEITFDVPRLFLPGHCIILDAIPTGNPNGTMVIKFMDGSTKRQMFHISLRFSQRIVAVNSMTEALEWRRDEERYGFPFAIEQMFRMAIAFTETSFNVAIDGERFFSYAYRYSNSFLDRLMGISVQTSSGIQLEVQGIDHMNLESSDCEGFEALSHPDVD